MVSSGDDPRPSWLNEVDGVAGLRDLPEWLLAPLQEESVLASLRLHVPEFASDAWQVSRCQVDRLYLKDVDGAWEGTYVLTARTAPNSDWQTILLHGKVFGPSSGGPAPAAASTAFGSAQWNVVLPEIHLNLEMEEPEKELASLPELVDPERSRRLLEDILRAKLGDSSQVSILRCSPKILSYKPGVRCTIRYKVEYGGSPGCPACPSVAIGKVYHNGSKAQNAYAGMEALWASPLSRGDVVTIAMPLGYLPEQKAMFQAAIPGESSLEDLLRSALDNPGAREELTRFIRKTARGLAALHRSSVDEGHPVTFEKQISRTGRVIDRLAARFPDRMEQIRHLLAHMSRYAQAHPAGQPVPSHGKFHPEQVLIDGEAIGFIDFDDFCLAEPALDVGLFRAAVKDTGLNAMSPSQAGDHAARMDRLVHLDAIADLFLAEYEKVAPVSRERVVLWETIEYLRGSLDHWVKVKPAEQDYPILSLIHHLEQMDQLT